MPETVNASLRIRLSQVRDFAHEVEAYGTSSGLPESKIFAVNLTLDELIANLVMYGMDGVVKPRIDVELKRVGNTLVLRIEDNGRPFDPTQEVEPDLESELLDRPVGGLGRYFVKRIADRFSYEYVDGRNRITVEYDLPSDED